MAVAEPGEGHGVVRTQELETIGFHQRPVQPDQWRVARLDMDVRDPWHDDLAQQVFLQAFRKIGQFSRKSQIGTWIYRVAVNEALQHLRKAKRSRVQLLEQEPMDRSPDSHENVDDKELLEQAMGLLDPELRSAFLLREVEGLSYHEIANALEVPEGTVGSRLNRARRELRQHLTELGWEP